MKNRLTQEKEKTELKSRGLNNSREYREYEKINLRKR